MNEFIHTRKTCILPRYPDHLIIYIKALDISLNITQYFILSFLVGILPYTSGHNMLPPLCGKASVHTGCHIQSHHGGLYREGSASAEGIHQHSVSPPRSQHNKRRCQVLCNGSLSRQLTIASLVQGITGCVKRNRHPVLMNEYSYGITVTAFLKPLYPIGLSHPVNHSFFHD